MIILKLLFILIIFPVLSESKISLRVQGSLTCNVEGPWKFLIEIYELDTLVDDLIYRYGYTNYTESVISFCTDIFQEDPFGDGWFDSHIEIGYRFYAWCGAYHVASWDSQPIRLKTRSYESFIYIEYNGHDYTTKHYALCDKFYC
uniref:S-protein homolog n=1 Tax=Caenorhabditis tropicalis TaxID=1561998 RepID=A0A1I7TZW8_9PELO